MAFTQISGNGLKDNSITNAHLHSGAAIAGSKIDPSFTSNITITNTAPIINFTDSDNNSDYRIVVQGGEFFIQDTTNSNATRLRINSSGTIVAAGNLDVGAGLDVTGNITATGNITSGSNSSIFAENNLRFKSTGDAFIDHNTTGQDINFRVSNSSSLDTTPLVVNASGISVTGNIAVSGTVDGRDLATDGTKLDGIAANATNVTNYVTNDSSDTLTGGTYTFSNAENQKIILSGSTNPYIGFQEGTTNKAYIQWDSAGHFQFVNTESGEYLRISSGVNGLTFTADGTQRTVFHSGNSNFVTDNASDTLTGDTYTFSSSTNEKIILSGASFPFIRFQEGTTNKAFIQWNADGYLRLRNEEAQDELRIGDGNFGLQFVIDSTARNVLHSGNVGSYALPIGGGTLTGSLNIGDGSGQARLYLQKADNNVSDHIIFYNGTNRIGEIGCEDNTWLRINQETAKNIYTPRLIRADNGFQVEGSTVIDGNKNHAVPANAEINFGNSSVWTGNHTKIQMYSNYLYIVGGANGIAFREGDTNRWFVGGNGHFIPGANNTYDIGESGTMVRDIYSSTVYLGQSTRYLSNVTGQYGSVQINGSGVNGYEGYSIDGRYVLMHNGSNDGGLYNDVDNEWYLYTQRNGTTIMYFNGGQRIRTESYGARIAGTFRPDVNNARDLGASDARWATFYVVNQPNVSDRNEKNTIQNSDLGLDFINKLRAVSFKWNDASLGTKTRYGLIVQEVEDAVKELGKNPDDLGMIDKPEFGSMGLCVNELVAPFVKAIQELSAKVAALEAA